MTKIYKYEAAELGLNINSEIEKNNYFSKWKPLSGSSYIILLKELNFSRECLINIQNINGNECVKWRLVKSCRHPSNKN